MGGRSVQGAGTLVFAQGGRRQMGASACAPMVSIHSEGPSAKGLFEIHTRMIRAHATASCSDGILPSSGAVLACRRTFIKRAGATAGCRR